MKVSPKEVRAEYLRLLGEFLIVASEMGGIDAIDFKKKLKEMKKKYKQINKSLLDKNLHKYERQLDHLLQKQASLLEKIKEDINEQSAKLDSIMIDKSIKGQDGESRTK